MKRLISALVFLSVAISNGQAFKGKEDQKFQVGFNAQDEATGIHVTYDYGLGENISVGVATSYALGIDNRLDADFGDRFDLEARFNANIGNVINIDENLDIYPGLNLSLKNFGGHFGARYFFTEGFGVYTEANFPIAKYDDDKTKVSYYIHNQFTINFGATFNL